MIMIANIFVPESFYFAYSVASPSYNPELVICQSIHNEWVQVFDTYSYEILDMLFTRIKSHYLDTVNYRASNFGYTYRYDLPNWTRLDIRTKAQFESILLYLHKRLNHLITNSGPLQLTDIYFMDTYE